MPTIGKRIAPDATCTTVANAPETLAALASNAWSLLTLDLGLPGGTEMDTLRQARALRPDLPILIVSMFPESKFGPPAIRAGANGYLTKSAERPVIEQAIRQTLEGGSYLSPQLQELLSNPSASSHDPHTLLSPRELKVLCDLGAGYSNKEVAARLNIGVTSVATYRARLLEKLSLRSSADLVRYAIEHHLLR